MYSIIGTSIIQLSLYQRPYQLTLLTSIIQLIPPTTMTIPADSTDIDHPADSINNDDTPVDFTDNENSVIYDKINCHLLYCYLAFVLLSSVNLFTRLITQNNLRGWRSYRPRNTFVLFVVFGPNLFRRLLSRVKRSVIRLNAKVQSF